MTGRKIGDAYWVRSSRKQFKKVASTKAVMEVMPVNDKDQREQMQTGRASKPGCLPGIWERKKERGTTA